jgi:hypothetical protein
MTYCIPAITGDPDSVSVGELMLLKMLRLAKLARLVKALRYPVFTELKAMVFGVVSGLRVLMWAILLLFVIVFFIGVILKTLIPDEEGFTTVPASMFTIFRCFTDGCSAYDGTPLSERLRQEYGVAFLGPYVITFMFVVFGVFNLIMAIFIDNVVGTNEHRKQIDLGNSRSFITMRFKEVFTKLILHKGVARTPQNRKMLPSSLKAELMDKWKEDVTFAFSLLPKDLAVSRKVFNKWMEDPELMNLLEEADIQTANAVDLFEVLDADMSGELTVPEVIDGLIRLRGPTTKSDMIAVRMKVQYITHMVQAIATRLGVEEPIINIGSP